MRNKIIACSVIVILSSAVVITITSAQTLGIMAKDRIARAEFTSEGMVKLPTDFHHWVHVGTFIKENGINIFDGSKITVPLIGNTYVEPGAWSHFMATGKWGDGSQIVKEFTEAYAGENCDNETTHLCRTPIGIGIYQNNYAGFGYMVKDKKRFQDEAGNWAYFTSGHLKPPYPETATIKARENCASCHIQRASDQDYVFARQKIGLERNNPDNK